MLELRSLFLVIFIAREVISRGVKGYHRETKIQNCGYNHISHDILDGKTNSRGVKKSGLFLFLVHMYVVEPTL